MKNKDYIEHLQKRLKYTHRLLHKMVRETKLFDKSNEEIGEYKDIVQLKTDIRKTLKEPI